MTTLYLCAAGNPDGVRLAIEVNAAEKRWDRIVLLDDDPTKLGCEIMGVPVIGPFEALSEHQPGDQAVNLVARSTKGRDRARAKIEGFGLELTSLIHPSTSLFGATVGRAVTIYAGCTVSALSSVGDHAVIFTQAVLGHGASLGTGGVIAPGAVVNARVQVGDRAYIGSNASVLPDLVVSDDATVSACSAVISDIPAGCTALGVPAEVMGAGATIVPSITPNAEFDRMQADLCGVFGAALKHSDYRAEMNFFEVGGDSKQAVALLSEIQNKLGMAVSIIDLFRCPSPALLASQVVGDQGTTAPRTRAEMRRQRMQKRS